MILSLFITYPIFLRCVIACIRQISVVLSFVLWDEMSTQLYISPFFNLDSYFFSLLF